MKFIAFCIALGIPAGLQACDFCNCYLGLNPHYKKNTIGLRYHFSGAAGSHHSSDELEMAGLDLRDFSEHQIQMEAYGQWYPVQTVQIHFSAYYGLFKERHPEGSGTHANGLPHAHGSMQEDPSGDSGFNGWGDPLVLVRYQVFNRTSQDTAVAGQRLFAGLGVKLPFGRYRPGPGTTVSEFGHFPGTGSLDGIASASFLARHGSLGLNVNASFLATTANDLGYRFGNRLNTEALVYYTVSCGPFSLYPSLGSYFELASHDRYEGQAIDNSGGSILYAHAGIDLYAGRLAFHLAGQVPVVQALHMPQAKSRYRMSAGISMAFD